MEFENLSIAQRREIMNAGIAAGGVEIDGEWCTLDTEEDIRFWMAMCGFDHYGDFME